MSDSVSIPERFPTWMWDRFISMEGFCMNHLTIQLELTFDFKLDAPRLARAVELTLDAEPILGCRFVIHKKHPYWQRLDTADRGTFFEPADDEDAYEAFKRRMIDSFQGPLIQACLFSEPKGDRLTLKMAHEAGDAGGMRDVTRVLSTIYNHLAVEPDYLPEPNITGSRDFHQVLRYIPWHAYPRIFLNMWSSLLPRIIKPVVHKIQLSRDMEGDPVYVRALISEDRVTKLIEYCHQRDATLNDLFLSAYLRVLAFHENWDGKSQLRLLNTVNLRRYIPSGRAGGICNLSGNEWLSLGTDPGDDFGTTIDRMRALTKKCKASWIGLGDSIFSVPLIVSLPYGLLMEKSPEVIEDQINNQSIPDTFSNIGRIDLEEVTFGAPPVDAWPLPPPNYPPIILVCLSGYQGTLSLSAGTFPAQKDHVDKFFHSIIEELPD